MSLERVFVGLGSNLGDRRATLVAAVRKLRATEGVEVKRTSALYETSPVGGPAQGDYLNAAVELATLRAPGELLHVLQQIESELGRVRDERWGPRSLDLDLLLYGGERVETQELQVPHPRLFERRFVLAPLCDLAPDVVHPTLGRPLAALLAGAPAGDAVVQREKEGWADADA